jgi:hypothetical protein
MRIMEPLPALSDAGSAKERPLLFGLLEKEDQILYG